MDNNHNFIYFFSDYDFEVIIIDDGSPDGTLEVAKELQEIYGSSKIVMNEKEYKMQFYNKIIHVFSGLKTKGF